MDGFFALRTLVPIAIYTIAGPAYFTTIHNDNNNIIITSENTVFTVPGSGDNANYCASFPVDYCRVTGPSQAPRNNIFASALPSILRLFAEPNRV